mgnify:CR=1 FL=1
MMRNKFLNNIYIDDYEEQRIPQIINKIIFERFLFSQKRLSDKLSGKR